MSKTPSPQKMASPQKSQPSANCTVESIGSSSTSSQQLYQLPFTKIRSIMQMTPDCLKPTDEGLFAITKATVPLVAILALFLAINPYDFRSLGETLLYFR